MLANWFEPFNSQPFGSVGAFGCPPVSFGSVGALSSAPVSFGSVGALGSAPVSFGSVGSFGTVGSGGLSLLGSPMHSPSTPMTTTTTTTSSVEEHQVNFVWPSLSKNHKKNQFLHKPGQQQQRFTQCCY